MHRIERYLLQGLQRNSPLPLDFELELGSLREQLVVCGLVKQHHVVDLLLLLPLAPLLFFLLPSAGLCRLRRWRRCLLLTLTLPGQNLQVFSKPVLKGFSTRSFSIAENLTKPTPEKSEPVTESEREGFSKGFRKPIEQQWN